MDDLELKLEVSLVVVVLTSSLESSMIQSSYEKNVASTLVILFPDCIN